MKNTRPLWFAVLSLLAAAEASAVVLIPPPTPPPFGPLPTRNNSGNNTGNGMRTGQIPGGNSTSISAQAQTNAQAGTTPVVTVAPTKTPDITVPAPAAIVPSGHIELFNGKDLLGWQFVTAGGADAKQTWSVEDGLIKCTGKPNGYARTGQAYKDYKVTVEWRFPPGKEGNTGVIVHVQPPETMNPWPKCIECQGRHTSQGDFWFWNNATCKELTSLPADQIQGRNKNGIKRQAADAEKPVGEWNTFSVVCLGNTVTIYVNDKEVNKITDCNLDSGYIGLQSEGAGVEIRRVSLDPAPKDAPKATAAAAAN